MDNQHRPACLFIIRQQADIHSGCRKGLFIIRICVVIDRDTVLVYLASSGNQVIERTAVLYNALGCALRVRRDRFHHGKLPCDCKIAALRVICRCNNGLFHTGIMLCHTRIIQIGMVNCHNRAPAAAI